MNNQIKVLSWNYDIQFERSLQRFINKKIHFIQSKFQIFPNKNSIEKSEGLPIEKEEFAMVKMNGNAIWDEFVNQPPLKNTPTIYDSNTDIKETKTLLEFYLSKYNHAFFNPHSQRQNEPLDYFNFAWENDKSYREKYNGHEKNLEAAEFLASQTEILVVIGYSFPIFNREIDNHLFHKMQNLQKVYIQDKEPEKIQSTMQNAFEILQQKITVNSFGNPVTSSVNSNELRRIPKVAFQLESNTNQFVIPFELNQ